MQTKPYIFSCPGVCWVAGIAFGLLVAFLLGLGFILGLIVGLILGVASALVLKWAFCRGHALAQNLPPAHGVASKATAGQADDVSSSSTQPATAEKAEAAREMSGVADAAQAETEAAKPEAAKLDAAKVEAAKAETAKTDAVSAEAAKQTEAKPAAVKTPKSKAANGDDSAAATTKAAKAEAKSVAPKAGKTKTKSAKTAAETDERAVAADGKPELLTAARGGKADNLKEIKGVGPKLEAMLHKMGVFHFDQIAAWRAAEVEWVDANLEGFKGRVTRDTWVEQAKVLAAGGTTEFSARVEKGGVY
jgi:predicted flap endonuclease-1-like 5' DNA nuclease